MIHCAMKKQENTRKFENLHVFLKNVCGLYVKVEGKQPHFTNETELPSVLTGEATMVKLPPRSKQK